LAAVNKPPVSPATALAGRRGSGGGSWCWCCCVTRSWNLVTFVSEKNRFVHSIDTPPFTFLVLLLFLVFICFSLDHFILYTTHCSMLLFFILFLVLLFVHLHFINSHHYTFQFGFILVEFLFSASHILIYIYIYIYTYIYIYIYIYIYYFFIFLCRVHA